MLTDISILGIAFAIILLVIAFSAMVLYLAFRIKETFREEKKRGMQIVKIAFIVGILFLAGGLFYFFSGALTHTPTPPPSPSPSTYTLTVYSNPSGVTFTLNDVSYTTPYSASSSSETHLISMPSQTTIDGTVYNFSHWEDNTQNPQRAINLTTSKAVTAYYTSAPPVGKPSLTLTISYPPKVRLRSSFTLSFTIVNPTEYVAHDVTIQANVLFQYFEATSSTHEIIGNVINIGDVPPGTTISSLTLTTLGKVGEIRDTITLTFKEMGQPITQDIVITITGGP